MDPLLSLLVGPLGQSFRLFKKYNMLPKRSNYIELSDDMYEKLYKQFGMPSERMFVFIPIDFTGMDDDEVNSVSEQYIIDNAKELLIVTEIEKREMLRAVGLVFKSTQDMPRNTSGADRIDKFLNRIPIFK